MIFTLLVALNEEDLLPYQLEHCMTYSDKVIVYDNESSDRTIEIAKEFGADVRTFKTGGKVNDKSMIDVFNLSYLHLQSSEDWMFCHSVDEFIISKCGDIRERIAEYNVYGVNAIEAKLYEMIADKSTDKFVNRLHYGYPAENPWAQKVFAYRRGIIPNWSIGAHGFSVNVNKPSIDDFIIAHAKYALGLDRVIERHKKLAVSDINKSHMWSWHFENDAWTKEYYNRILSNLVKVI